MTTNANFTIAEQTMTQEMPNEQPDVSGGQTESHVETNEVPTSKPQRQLDENNLWRFYRMFGNVDSVFIVSRAKSVELNIRFKDGDEEWEQPMPIPVKNLLLIALDAPISDKVGILQVVDPNVSDRESNAKEKNNG